MQTVEMKVTEIMWLKPGHIWNGDFRIRGTSALDKKLVQKELPKFQTFL